MRSLITALLLFFLCSALPTYSDSYSYDYAASGDYGVASFTGDNVLLNNSGSTGAVTATLVNAAANSVLGNNTASPAAPAYQTSIALSGSTTEVINKNGCAVTTVNGTAGHYYWSQPEQGTGYKRVVIVLNSYTNSSTSAISFTTAFTHTPDVFVGTGATGVTLTSVSTSGCTVPIIASGTTGTITIEGIQACTEYFQLCWQQYYLCCLVVQIL